MVRWQDWYDRKRKGLCSLRFVPRRKLTRDTQCFIKAEQTERKSHDQVEQAPFTLRKSGNENSFRGKKGEECLSLSPKRLIWRKAKGRKLMWERWHNTGQWHTHTKRQRMRLSFNGPLCACEKGLCQFQPGLPLLGKSTMTQLVTWCVHWPVAKTSESCTKNKRRRGQLQSSPPSWKNTYMLGHHGRFLCRRQVGCSEHRTQCREDRC